MNLKLKRILKIAALLFGLYAIYILYHPTVYMDQDTGYVHWRWSGFKAIFTEDKFGFRSKYYREAEYSGLDGPYVMNEGNDLVAYRITHGNILLKEKISRYSPLKVEVPNESNDIFHVRIKDSIDIAGSIYSMPSKLIAVSDIEGNFSGLYSFLVNNGVMDEKYNWIFGDGHLVLVGDFVDRGKCVTQVLWLIYSLEDKAREHGGMVHYILGNHEVMNIEGNAKYAEEKYIKLAQDISGEQQWNKAYRYLFAPNTELGAWLRKKNSIEKIGRYVFVHAGISTEMLKYSPSLETVNSTIRKNIDTNRPSDHFANFVLGSNGPLWYRGMAIEHKDEIKMDKIDFKKVLAYLNADKIVIGHTIAEDVQYDYGKQLIRIDVHHGQVKASGQTKGLLIDNGVEYKINDKGQKVPL